MSIKTFIVPVFGMLTLANVAPAVAQTGVDQDRRVITFAREQLMTAEGRAAIDRRLVRAANRICSISNGRLALSTRVDSACQVRAMADARRQLADRVASAVGQVQVATVAGNTTQR